MFVRKLNLSSMITHNLACVSTTKHEQVVVPRPSVTCLCLLVTQLHITSAVGYQPGIGSVAGVVAQEVNLRAACASFDPHISRLNCTFRLDAGTRLELLFCNVHQGRTEEL